MAPESDLSDLDSARDDLDGDSSDVHIDDKDAETKVDSQEEENHPSGTKKPASKIGGSRRSTAKAAKAKAQAKTLPKKHQRGKIVKGKKWCRACMKWLPVEQFPAGSGQCAEDRKILQNLRNAAEAQGKARWFDSLQTGPEERLAHVVLNYKNRVQHASGSKKKAGVFPIAQYKEEVRQERNIITEGIMEMMHKQHYVAWAGKAKNGSVPAEEAAEKWTTLYNAPGRWLVET